MYTDEKVTKFVKSVDYDGLRAMYDSGEIKHGEYMRAVDRAKRERTVNLTSENYSQTKNTLYTVYNRILIFVFIDLILSYMLKLWILKGSLTLVLIVYIIAIYIPMCIYVWKLKGFNLKKLSYPTTHIKKNTLALRIWFFVQFVPIVSVIADFMLLYYSLSCKLHMKNMEKNDYLTK